MELPSLTLVMVQGPREGETLEFRPGSTIRIGRLVRGNTVPIKDDGISSKHLSIESSSSGPGKWILRDLDSSNGTLLNATKLLPDTPYDLRGGDSIKIGEYTSILVKIDSHEESQLRRNPRRRAAEKETLEPVADNRGRRGKPSKESEAKCDEKGEELETGNRRKGRQRKARLLKTEDDAEELCDQGPENVGPVEGKPVRQTSKRCTRSAKNEESIVFDRVLRKIPKNSGVECGEVEIKVKKTRPGARKRMNLSKESPDCAKVDAMENKENVKETNLEEIIRIDVGRDAARGVDASRNEETTKETNLEENDQINVDGAVSEIDENVERGASHGVREEGLDLANMTLGDWLDYLEVHLPKHIIDSTEEMIEGMRQKADRVRRYIVEQTTQRSKVPGDGRHLRCVHNNPQGGHLPDYAPHPAIVLKMEDGTGLLLPIIVLEMPSVLLMAALRNVPIARPTLYQVIKEMIDKMGYEVRLVRVTKRVHEAYFAQLYLTKVGNGTERVSFDLRPSDAINIAVRCKVPIQVNKYLAYSDGMRVIESGKLSMQTPASDGLLFTEMDRPNGQPCIETKEFDLVRNMLIAAVEERYRDAAQWRDKLSQLRARRNLNNSSWTL